MVGFTRAKHRGRETPAHVTGRLLLFEQPMKTSQFLLEFSHLVFQDLPAQNLPAGCLGDFLHELHTSPELLVGRDFSAHKRRYLGRGHPAPGNDKRLGQLTGLGVGNADDGSVHDGGVGEENVFEFGRGNLGSKDRHNKAVSH